MKQIVMVMATLALTLAIIMMPASVVRAASIADNMGGSGGNNSTITSNTPLSSSGSTEAGLTASTDANSAKSVVLTAATDKPVVAAGGSQTIHVKAAMDNGTGIPDVTIQAIVQDYVTGKQRVLLGGQTDDKGMIDLTATIGPHAKTGQFLVIVNASKDNLPKQTIATGFTVNEKGGSSSSGSTSGSTSGSSSSGAKCSGSSCK